MAAVETSYPERDINAENTKRPPPIKVTPEVAGRILCCVKENEESEALKRILVRAFPQLGNDVHVNGRLGRMTISIPHAQLEVAEKIEEFVMSIHRDDGMDCMHELTIDTHGARYANRKPVED